MEEDKIIIYKTEDEAVGPEFSCCKICNNCHRR